MARKRFNPSNQVISTPNSLTLANAQLFLEDSKIIYMNNKDVVKNVPVPTKVKVTVNKEFGDHNLITSNHEIYILSKNIDELRKVCQFYTQENVVVVSKCFC